MIKMMKKFAQDECGASAVEYGLIAGLIGVVVVASLTSIGTKLNVKFGRINSALN